MWKKYMKDETHEILNLFKIKKSEWVLRIPQKTFDNFVNELICLNKKQPLIRVPPNVAALTSFEKFLNFSIEYLTENVSSELWHGCLMYIIKQYINKELEYDLFKIQ